MQKLEPLEVALEIERKRLPFHLVRDETVKPGSVIAERPLFPPPATGAGRDPEDAASAEVLAAIRRQAPERLTPLEALTLVDTWSRLLKKGTAP